MLTATEEGLHTRNNRRIAALGSIIKDRDERLSGLGEKLEKTGGAVLALAKDHGTKLSELSVALESYRSTQLVRFKAIEAAQEVARLANAGAISSVKEEIGASLSQLEEKTHQNAQNGRDLASRLSDVTERLAKHLATPPIDLPSAVKEVLKEQKKEFSAGGAANLADSYTGPFDKRKAYSRGDTFTFNGGFYLVLKAIRGEFPSDKNTKGKTAAYALIAAPGLPALLPVGESGGGGGGGSVTSVGLTAPSMFSVANSPVTSSGNLALSLANQSANTFLAGPSSGGAAIPTFRQITASDISGLTPGGTYAADITALKAINVSNLSDGQPVYVVSLGTTFKYDASSTATANDMDVVQPTSGAGRYLLRTERFNQALTGTAAIDSSANEVLRVQRYYDQSTPSGYSYAGSCLDATMVVGQNATASGTQVGVWSNSQVYAMNGGTNGTDRTEVAAFAGFVNPIAGQANGGQNYWGHDLTVNGPGFGSTTASREGFLVGCSVFVGKYTTGNALDSSHDGSYGVSVVTRPGSGGNSGDRTGQTTYPILAGVRVAGVSGAVGTVGNGTDSGATNGFTYGVHVGGVGGSAWLQYNGRSRIGEGVRIEDYTSAALHILNSLGTPYGIIQANNTGYNGLWTETPTHILDLGAPTGQFENSIKIAPTTHVSGSKRAGMEFDAWTIGQDIQGNGTKSFFIYDGSATRYFIDTSGNSLFNVAASTSALGTVHVGTGSAQFGAGIYVAPSTHATSRRSSITFDGWVIGQDGSGNGTKDFFAFDGNTSNVRLRISTAGDMTVVGGGITTSTPSGGSQGKWKFGQAKAGAIVVNTSNYIELEVDGTLYKLVRAT